MPPKVDESNTLAKFLTIKKVLPPIKSTVITSAPPVTHTKLMQRTLQNTLIPIPELKKRKRKTKQERELEVLREADQLRNTSSIFRYVKRPGLIARAKNQIRMQQEAVVPAPTAIPYRDDGNVRGKGATFDHLAVQKTTKSKTTILLVGDKNEHLTEYLSNNDPALPQNKKQAPPVIRFSENTLNQSAQEADIYPGLLYIPGIPSDIKQSKKFSTSERHHEMQQFIQDALLRGKPLLAVCGGAWELWEAVAGANNLIPVKDHCWSQGMPRINGNSEITHNVEVHRIQFTTTESHLYKMMQPASLEIMPTVNSLHWLAPDPTKTPQHVINTARAKGNPNFSAKSRAGAAFEPEEDSIEAFEIVSGAPVIGVLWHPEAFASMTDDNANQHHALIIKMQQAGTAYQQRCKMLAQFKQTFFGQERICDSLKHKTPFVTLPSGELTTKTEQMDHKVWVDLFCQDNPPLQDDAKPRYVASQQMWEHILEQREDRLNSIDECDNSDDDETFRPRAKRK